MMVDGTEVRVNCRLLADGLIPAELRLSPTSCGLDFWHSPAALAWQSQFLNARPALITLEAGSRSAALCCLFRKLPFEFVLASAYPYAAVVGDSELFWQHGAAIARVLRRLRVLRLEMPFTGEYSTQLPSLVGSSSSFRAAPELDAVRHVLDLDAAGRDPGWLIGQLAPNTRWAIRKSERMGGSVRLGTPGDLATVHRIYVAAMRAKGAPVNYGLERFRGMLEELSDRGAARIYIGELHGNPVGIAAVLDAGISRHLLQIAVLPGMQSARLSELLVSTAIGAAISEGRRYFDFMASSPQDAGLIAFKAKWATREEPIRYAILTATPGLDRAIDLGRWLNAWRGRSASREIAVQVDMSGAESP